MKALNKSVLTILLALIMSLTAAAGAQYPDYQGKPPERPKEREKDPPKRDPPKPSDDKKGKPKKPDYNF